MSTSDLYGDLNYIDLGEKIIKLKQDNQSLLNLVRKLQEDILKLCNELTAMKKTESSLKRNISELYKSSKLELERKDHTIADLQRQIDCLVFKRDPNRTPGSAIRRLKIETYYNRPLKRPRIEDSGIQKLEISKSRSQSPKREIKDDVRIQPHETSLSRSNSPKRGIKDDVGKQPHEISKSRSKSPKRGTNDFRNRPHEISKSRSNSPRCRIKDERKRPHEISKSHSQSPKREIKHDVKIQSHDISKSRSKSPKRGTNDVRNRPHEISNSRSNSPRCRIKDERKQQHEISKSRSKSPKRGIKDDGRKQLHEINESRYTSPKLRRIENNIRKLHHEIIESRSKSQNFARIEDDIRKLHNEVSKSRSTSPTRRSRPRYGAKYIKHKSRDSNGHRIVTLQKNRCQYRNRTKQKLTEHINSRDYDYKSNNIKSKYGDIKVSCDRNSKNITDVKRTANSSSRSYRRHKPSDENHSIHVRGKSEQNKKRSTTHSPKLKSLNNNPIDQITCTLDIKQENMCKETEPKTDNTNAQALNGSAIVINNVSETQTEVTPPIRRRRCIIQLN